MDESKKESMGVWREDGANSNLRKERRERREERGEKREERWRGGEKKL